MQTIESEERADTMVMGVMHNALRRDLERTRTTVGSQPQLPRRQQQALASHLIWMLDWLDEHHQVEDDTLWPLISRRNPSADQLLRTMDRDHQAIAGEVTGVRAAAAAFAAGERQSREGLLESLRHLDEVLTPHLDREESQMMPVVAETLSAAEWQDWAEKAHPKMTLAEGAYRFNWFLDDLDRERSQQMLALLPTPARFAVISIFGPRYRRTSVKRWGT